MTLEQARSAAWLDLVRAHALTQQTILAGMQQYTAAKQLMSCVEPRQSTLGGCSCAMCLLCHVRQNSSCLA